MADTRSRISKKNPYYISQHRYLELKNYCYQYIEWKEEYNYWDGLKSPTIEDCKILDSDVSDPTAKIAMRKAELSKRIEMIDKTAMEAAPEIFDYMMLCITEGRSFVNLSAKLGIPCGKDYFSTRYRKFFWLLDKRRDGAIFA